MKMKINKIYFNKKMMENIFNYKTRCKNKFNKKNYNISLIGDFSIPKTSRFNSSAILNL